MDNFLFIMTIIICSYFAFSIGYDIGKTKRNKIRQKGK